MSVKTAIDTAIKRGASPVMIARTFGVSIASIEKRIRHIAARTKAHSEARIRYLESAKFHSRPANSKPEEIDARTRNSIARWVALPIRYEDDARSKAWNAGAAARNDAMLARKREHWRSLGGVSDWSHTRSE